MANSVTFWQILQFSEILQILLQCWRIGPKFSKCNVISWKSKQMDSFWRFHAQQWFFPLSSILFYFFRGGGGGGFIFLWKLLIFQQQPPPPQKTTFFFQIWGFSSPVLYTYYNNQEFGLLPWFHTCFHMLKFVLFSRLCKFCIIQHWLLGNSVFMSVITEKVVHKEFHFIKRFMNFVCVKKASSANSNLLVNSLL